MKNFVVRFKDTKRVVALILAMVMTLGMATTLVACKDKRPAVDNESTRLVLASSELDGVFNPFYSTSAADGSVVGMTQIGMLSSDKDGKVAYGENEACVVLDYEAVTIKEGDEVKETIYYFVLKNNLKFSDGSPLTMKDVLFNLYVYLDPAYYGSATIYSTDIIGLQEYRTQTKNENEQKDFNKQFNDLASDRVYRLIECLDAVYDEHKNVSLTEDEMIVALTEQMELNSGDPAYATVVNDYNLAVKYFREELKTDYTNSKGTAQDTSFTDKNGNKVTLTTDTEAFLYNEGFITWNKDEKKFEYSLGENSKNMTEEEAINAIFTSYVPNKMIDVVSYWATAQRLLEYFSFLEKQAYFESIDEEDRIKNISGVKYANRTESVTVNGKEYGVPSLDANGTVISGNEVLSIAIEKVDPKAIWNFAFTVAPMYYYSNAEQIAAFDYESNFGVQFGSVEFQDAVIKNPDKIGVPVGAI